MRMVTLVFQNVGVMRVAHIMIKSLWMVSRISCGSILSSSFIMPSGPGDLSLLRVLMHSEKDFGVEPPSLLEPLGFILRNM